MKIAAISLGLTLIIGACSAGGDYVGTKRGWQGTVDALGTTVDGGSTTYLKDSESPMPTMTSRADGSLAVTGQATILYGLAALCRQAPASPLCGANLPPEMLALLLSGE